MIEKYLEFIAGTNLISAGLLSLGGFLVIFTILSYLVGELVRGAVKFMDDNEHAMPNPLLGWLVPYLATSVKDSESVYFQNIWGNNYRLMHGRLHSSYRADQWQDTCSYNATYFPSVEEGHKVLKYLDFWNIIWSIVTPVGLILPFFLFTLSLTFHYHFDLALIVASIGAFSFGGRFLVRKIKSLTKRLKDVEGKVNADD